MFKVSTLLETPFRPAPRFDAIVQVVNYLNESMIDVSWMCFQRLFLKRIRTHEYMARTTLEDCGIEYSRHGRHSIFFVKDCIDLDLRMMLLKCISDGSGHWLDRLREETGGSKPMMTRHVSRVINSAMRSLDCNNGGEQSCKYVAAVYRTAIRAVAPLVTCCKKPGAIAEAIRSTHTNTCDIVLPVVSHVYAIRFADFISACDNDAGRDELFALRSRLRETMCTVDVTPLVEKEIFNMSVERVMHCDEELVADTIIDDIERMVRDNVEDMANASFHDVYAHFKSLDTDVMKFMCHHFGITRQEFCRRRMIIAQLMSAHA